MPWPLIVAASLAYLLGLFAIAYWADRRADAGRSVIASPYVYALSLGVFPDLGALPSPPSIVPAASAMGGGSSWTICSANSTAASARATECETTTMPTAIRRP